MTKNTGRSFEILTKTVFESLAKLEGFKILEVKSPKTLPGRSGGKHNVDVYLKYELFGRERETVIEAKDHKTPVDLPTLMTFKAVLSELIGSPTGIFVTRKGFDEGSILPIAESNGIGLYILDDYVNLTNQFTLSVIVHRAQITNIIVAEGIDLSLIAAFQSIPAAEALLYDEAGNVKASIQQLMDSAFDEMVKQNVPVGGNLTLNLESPESVTYIHTQDARTPRIKVHGFWFKRMSKVAGEKVGGVHLTHLLQLVTGDKHYYVDSNGKILRAGDNITIPFTFESFGPNGEDLAVNVFVRMRDPARDVTDRM